MNYQKFEGELIEQLEVLAGEEVNIRVYTVQKNNGHRLRALNILYEGEQLSPTLYLEEYYREYKTGREIMHIARDLMGQWQKYRCTQDSDVELLMDYDNVKEHVLFKIINYEENLELLQEIPHERILDLAMVFYYQVPEQIILNATALIRKKDLLMWGGLRSR